MKCVNCGEISNYIYKGNSLCVWCFELTKLLEVKSHTISNLGFEVTNQKIKTCKYWIKVQRNATDFHYPEVIK